jgi:predicted O-methyltransferase YrrM
MGWQWEAPGHGVSVGAVEPPPLVRRAQALAAELGFTRSCRDADGALLHVLAGRSGVLRAAEIGTGAGVGTAWIASALPPGVPLFTVEVDASLAAAAARLFADDEDITVLAGAWRDVLPREAPFEFLFVDANDAKDDVDAVLGLLAPRGTAVLDDFTPGWPGPDPRREAWLAHPALSAVEVLTTPESAAMVAVRLS